MSTLTFAAVHTTARHLTFETLGDERHPEALATLTMELFDALPEARQDEVWTALGRRMDRLNEWLAEETQALAPASGDAPAHRGHRPGREATDAIRAVPLAYVVEALTGEPVARSGVLRCPLPDHDDRAPSFTVYADNRFHRFGCGAHGSALDFAAAAWGLDVRRDFPEVRDRLAGVLLGVAA